MVINDIYGNGGYGDFSIEDLNDKSGWTKRPCPKCKSELYNDVDIEKPEHDFCEKCGFNCKE